jgi:polyisoprenoid-binding protein YceI
MRFNKYVLSILAIFLLSSGIVWQAQAGDAPAKVNSPGASLTAPSPSAADLYSIDPAHSTIGFSVRHLIINNVFGRFKEFSGTINYDSSQISKSSVTFTAKVASIDTGVSQRDEHLRSKDFFEVATHPEMTFTSTKVEKKGNDSFVAYGNFTLKGVTKPIAIPFKVYGPVKDPWGKSRIGVEAALLINRQDYAVTWSQTLDGGGLVVGNEVNIHLNLEAVKN